MGRPKLGFFDNWVSLPGFPGGAAFSWFRTPARLPGLGFPCGRFASLASSVPGGLDALYSAGGLDGFLLGAVSSFFPGGGHCGFLGGVAALDGLLETPSPFLTGGFHIAFAGCSFSLSCQDFAVYTGFSCVETGGQLGKLTAPLATGFDAAAGFGTVVTEGVESVVTGPEISRRALDGFVTS